MSDERSPTSAATDDSGGADEAESDGDSSEPLESSGGPKRVVSDQSVDDILDSLDATKAGSTDSSDAVTTNGPSDAVTTNEPSDDAIDTAVDEDGVSAADEDGSDPATETTDESAFRSDERTNATDATSVDTAASSLPDDASLEELAARVDDGTVTGADVRAAEAGDGRESTPEIDEIDLSMDDLETARSGTGGSGGDTDVPADAGPLAGSVDPDADGGTSDDSTAEGGFLGRLKRFFSR
ncbi:hypothetical protein HYG81_04705 [Natrinema zhouii]|uniref:Uncharacterized protein n=1 Tax=Natrinema zhouii TaxID=1710539 RepID=A0A7D6CPZ9_9EURY|nr:hypothetical protein [Natrinema zhouii]QLK26915.1 hypothetical protein HYG81_04705 [Natrinema zhouii]